MNKIWYFCCMSALSLLFPAYVFAADFFPTKFVSTSGTSFVVGDQTFIPVGVNHHDETTLWNPSKTIPGFSEVTRNDFRTFASLGFTSIRLSVKADYFHSPKGFQWLDQRVKWAKQNGIRILLDMHIPSGGAQQDYQPSEMNQKFWNSAALQDDFVRVWRAVAKHYASTPTIWGYGLMNEPASRNIGQVKELYRRLDVAIRSSDRRHIILISPVQTYDEQENEHFVFPDISDNQLAYDVHFYQPYGFTVQNVPWGITDSRVISRYPSEATTSSPAWNADRIRTALDDAGLQAAREKSVPAIIGEFGTVFHEGVRGQYTWIQDVISAAKQAGVGWEYWVYQTNNLNGGFGLTDGRGGARKATLGLLADSAKDRTAEIWRLTNASKNAKKLAGLLVRR